MRETAEYLLFVDEVPLTAPVQGVSGFAATFAATGPRDQKGRSLRELDLKTRLFRYRCSYMIYSPAFDALPRGRAQRDLRHMARVLAGRGDRAVMEILDDTRKGWR